MADEGDFSSDTSDDDYVPNCDEADSDDETIEKDDPNDDLGEKTKANGKTKKSGGGLKARETKRGKQDSCAEEDTDNMALEANGDSVKSPEIAEACDKAKVDELWADFLKDVDQKPVNIKPTTSGSCTTPLTEPAKVKITKVFDFAGEEVRVTEEVNANSKEAKLALETPRCSQSPSTPKVSPGKRPAGLGSILSKLSGPKKKMSTLEKSRLDWNEFKEKEGIQDELKTHNKGKEGYLEKQAFLERADLRQYEVERNLRIRGRSNR